MRLSCCGHHAAAAPGGVHTIMVEVQRGTETGPAPAGQGATSAEYRAYPSEEQRRPAGCRAGRMPGGLSPRTARRLDGQESLRMSQISLRQDVRRAERGKADG